MTHNANNSNQHYPPSSLMDLIHSTSLKYGGMNVKLDDSIYAGKYDSKMYPFVEYYISQAKNKIIGSDMLGLRCPISSSNINMNNIMNENIFDLKKVKSKGFKVSDFSVIRSIGQRKQKGLQSPHIVISNICERINDILYRKPNIHLCWSMYDTICPLKGQDSSYIFVDAPTLTLRQFHNKTRLNEKQWTSIFFQIFYTLESIRKHLPGFVHNNLSVDSILIQKVKKGGQFIYKYKNKTYYVPNYGYVVKLIPSQYSNVPHIYDNVLLSNNNIQLNLGVSYDNKSDYDVHLFLNTVAHLKGIPDRVYELCVKLCGKEYICKNSKYVKNYRKRFGIHHQKLNTSKNILASSLFNTLKVVSNTRICLYPVMR